MFSTGRNVLQSSKFCRPLSQKLQCYYKSGISIGNTTDSKNYQFRFNNPKRYRSFLWMSSAFVGFGLTYYIHKYKEPVIFPAIYAGTPTGKSRRDLYNPIADTVQECADALVNIEIIDSRRYYLFIYLVDFSQLFRINKVNEVFFCRTSLYDVQFWAFHYKYSGLIF